MMIQLNHFQTMKTLNGQQGESQHTTASNVETYWVVDVFGHNDKVKVRNEAD